MQFLHFTVGLVLVLQSLALETVDTAEVHHRHHHKGKHHHHHHHKGHHHHHKHHNATAVVEQKHSEVVVKLAPKAVVKAPVEKKAAIIAKPVVKTLTKDEQLVEKMKALEVKLAQKKKSYAAAMEIGHLLVMGPLPKDFAERFSQAVSHAVGVDSKKVTVTKTAPVKGQPDVVAVDFKAPPKAVKEVQSQATDADSKLAQGNLHSFLVSKDDEEEADKEAAPAKPVKKQKKNRKEEAPTAADDSVEATPVEQKGIDIDTAMPYGDLEPFGREDTAQELTEDSVRESDSMVDQLERAEVAEEKRAVFRSLTRLRGAAITSFDGVARSQTGNIDEYNKIHQWRNTHPLHHLADEESDISKWAFPDNADF